MHEPFSNNYAPLKAVGTGRVRQVGRPSWPTSVGTRLGYICVMRYKHENARGASSASKRKSKGAQQMKTYYALMQHRAFASMKDLQKVPWHQRTCRAQVLHVKYRVVPVMTSAYMCAASATNSSQHALSCHSLGTHYTHVPVWRQARGMLCKGVSNI